MIRARSQVVWVTVSGRGEVFLPKPRGARNLPVRSIILYTKTQATKEPEEFQALSAVAAAAELLFTFRDGKGEDLLSDAPPIMFATGKVYATTGPTAKLLHVDRLLGDLPIDIQRSSVVSSTGSKVIVGIEFIYSANG